LGLYANVRFTAQPLIVRMNPAADRYALVVDANPRARGEAEAVLQEAGFRTLVADDVPLAVVMLERHAELVCLMCTAGELPSWLNGCDLAQRAAGRFPSIRSVVASSNQKPGPNALPQGAVFLDQAFGAGAVRYWLREQLSDS
jgi:CheY-like chemotaxis protein